MPKKSGSGSLIFNEEIKKGLVKMFKDKFFISNLFESVKVNGHFFKV